MKIQLHAIFLIIFAKKITTLNILTDNNNNSKIINKKIPIDGEMIFEKIQIAKELREYCRSTYDCRPNAYICTLQLCECAEGYRPDELNKTCVGAIGRHCMYDSHCITRAYCKGQMICTCKDEYPHTSDDKWSCYDDTDSFAVKLNPHIYAIMSIIIYYVFII